MKNLYFISGEMWFDVNGMFEDEEYEYWKWKRKMNTGSDFLIGLNNEDFLVVVFWKRLFVDLLFFCDSDIEVIHCKWLEFQQHAWQKNEKLGDEIIHLVSLRYWFIVQFIDFIDRLETFEKSRWHFKSSQLGMWHSRYSNHLFLFNSFSSS